MKRTTWLIGTALCAAFALPALAGPTGKCTLTTQACLDHWGKTRGEKPWAGIKYETREQGVTTVTSVTPGGPAAKAGLQVGDVLVELNGIRFTDSATLLKARSAWSVGTILTYTVTRAGSESLVALRLSAMPADEYASMVGAHMLESHFVAPVATVSDPATTITVPAKK
jgi:predicted metalloprotease with PDZ domain